MSAEFSGLVSSAERSDDAGRCVVSGDEEEEEGEEEVDWRVKRESPKAPAMPLYW